MGIAVVLPVYQSRAYYDMLEGIVHQTLLNRRMNPTDRFDGGVDYHHSPQKNRTNFQVVHDEQEGQLRLLYAYLGEPKA